MVLTTDNGVTNLLHMSNSIKLGWFIIVCMRCLVSAVQKGDVLYMSYVCHWKVCSN